MSTIPLFEEYVGGMQPIVSNAERQIQKSAMEGEDVGMEEEESDESYEHIRSMMEYNVAEEARLNGWGEYIHPDIGEISATPSYSNILPVEQDLVEGLVVDSEAIESLDADFTAVESVDDHTVYRLEVPKIQEWEWVEDHIVEPVENTLAARVITGADDRYEFAITFSPDVSDEYPSIRLFAFGEPLFDALIEFIDSNTTSASALQIVRLDQDGKEPPTNGSNWLVCGWTCPDGEVESEFCLDRDKNRDVDIVATREYPYPWKELIHSKQHSDEVLIDGPDILQYSALPRLENADTVVVVTTGRIAKDADQLSSRLDVRLVDCDQLCQIIHHYDYYPLIVEYIPSTNTGQQEVYLDKIVKVIVDNTGLQQESRVFGVLYSFFEGHSSNPDFSKQQTFEKWTQSGKGASKDFITVLTWDSTPSIDSDRAAEHILETTSNSGHQNVEQSVLSAAVETAFKDQFEPDPSELSPNELTEAIISELDRKEVPIPEDSVIAIEVGERVVDTNDSYQANKLRVAEELDQRKDEY